MAEIRVLFVPWKKPSQAELADKRMQALALADEYIQKNRRWLEYEEARSRAIKADHKKDFDDVRKAMFTLGPASRQKIEEVRSSDWFRKMMRQWYDIWYTGAEDPLLRSLGDGHIYIRGHSETALGKIGIPGRRGLENTLEPKEVARRLQESGLQTMFAGKIKCYNCHSAEAGEFSFAQKLADEMWELGYRSCSYFGYEGAIDSIPGQHDALSWAKGHRTSDSRKQDERLIRASQARRPIVPSQLKAGDRTRYIEKLGKFDQEQFTKEELFPKFRI